jgi:hypothetical protein
MVTYVTSVLGKDYRYRLVTRRELRTLFEEAQGDHILFEDLVFSLSVVETPEDFPGLDECLAGVPTAVVEQVLANSGYAPAASSGEGVRLTPPEEKALEWVRGAQSRVDMLICFCFPGITLNSLEDMNPEEYQKYVAGAHIVARSLYGMDIAAFLDPDSDGASPASARSPHPPGPIEPSGSPNYLFE